MLVVKSSFPAGNVHQFIAYARAHPDQLSGGYGSSATQVGIGMLQTRARIRVLAVPYKGVPQTALEVMGGQISFAFVDAAIGLAQIRGGKLKAIGVTSLARNRLAPDVPTFADELPGFELGTWYGLVAPAGTPRGIVQQLYEATSKGISRPEVRDRFASLGLELMPQAPDEFDAFIKSEVVKWAARIKEAGIEPE
jgi:tripartite-type tricarboxylate transporter receptor subunit TctC